MPKLFANPYVRLVGRALVAGLLAGAATWQNSAGWTVVWHSAAAAGLMVLAEVFTPLNALVGLFAKKA